MGDVSGVLQLCSSKIIWVCVVVYYMCYVYILYSM